jgi:seryl-tRNA synthetase
VPKELPAKSALDLVARVLADKPEAAKTFAELVGAAQTNLDELKPTVAQVQSLQQQLVKTESKVSELEAIRAELEKRLAESVTRAARLESELKVVQAQLANGAAQIATLQKTIADLQEQAKTDHGRSPRTVVDLVGELRADAAHLFAAPARVPDAPTGPGVIVDGLEFEIRGDLAIGDKIGIRPFPPDRAGPEGASVVRFSLKPEMRVEVPDEEKK